MGSNMRIVAKVMFKKAENWCMGLIGQLLDFIWRFTLSCNEIIYC